jgi:hypothetical protein
VPEFASELHSSMQNSGETVDVSGFSWIGGETDEDVELQAAAINMLPPVIKTRAPRPNFVLVSISKT